LSAAKDCSPKKKEKGKSESHLKGIGGGVPSIPLGKGFKNPKQKNDYPVNV
jgi:hypothetical protein